MYKSLKKLNSHLKENNRLNARKKISKYISRYNHIMKKMERYAKQNNKMVANGLEHPDYLYVINLIKNDFISRISENHILNLIEKQLLINYVTAIYKNQYKTLYLKGG